MKKRSICMMLLALLCLAVPAQDVKHMKESPAVQAFRDSLAQLSASYFAYFRMWDDLTTPAPRHVRQNPAYYKLFVPTTYYEASFDPIFKLSWSPDRHMPNATDSLYAVGRDTVRIYGPGNLETFAKVDRWINRLLRNVYLHHPDRIVQNEAYLANLKPLDDEQIVRKPKMEEILSFLQPEDPAGNVDADELVILKPNFWKKSGNGYLQFTQHNFSDNWYQGGENTNALLSGLVLNANYDNKQGIQFDNKLEIKLGFVTAPSDTVHKYKTNADMFRLNSKLGVRAIKNLYYTLAAEFKTQFFANYRTNSDDMISSFLSPAQVDVNLGMDYKLNKKNFSMSLLGAPFAYTFVYVGNERIVNPGAFNVKEGEKTANMFGSQITGNLTWKILPIITWTSKLDYFTTYDKVIANWENTFDFRLNRYLSTKVFIHGRFDDGVKLSGDNTSYFQWKQMLTFGLNYTW